MPCQLQVSLHNSFVKFLLMEPLCSRRSVFSTQYEFHASSLWKSFSLIAGFPAIEFCEVTCRASLRIPKDILKDVLLFATLAAGSYVMLITPLSLSR